MKLSVKYLTKLIAISTSIILASCSGRGAMDTEKTGHKEKVVRSDRLKLDPNARVVYHDRNNSFWLASKEKGVYRYDGDSLVLFTLADGLCSYSILSVQEDNLGHLYFDTPDGVCKYDGQLFTTLSTIHNEASKKEWISQPDDLWFRMGWSHGGPFRYDGENLYYLEFPKNKMEKPFYQQYPSASYNPYGIYSLFKDSRGNIWMGTSNLGLYMFDGEVIKWMYEKQLTDTPEGGSFGIRAIAEDKAGDYWICNTNYKYTLQSNNNGKIGLQSIDFLRQTGIEQKEPLYFVSSIVDDNGHLWMQTYQQGLWINNGKSLEPFIIRGDEVDILPTSVYKDRDGNIWMGTNQQGIYMFNGKTISKFKLIY